MENTQTVLPDTEVLALRLKEAYDLRTSDINRSISDTRGLLALFEKKGLHELQAFAKSHLGLYYLIQGELELARTYSAESLLYFQETKNIKGIADAQYNIGSIYYRTNKYHEALLLLQECLLIYRNLNDFYNQARTLKSIGTIYEYFNDENKAVECYENSIEACHKINEIGLESNALNPLSSIYFKQGKKELAMETIEKSILFKKETNDIRGLAFALYGRAKIYIKLSHYEKAIADLNETIRIQIEVGDKMGLSMAYNKLGVAYMQTDQLGDAKSFFIRALEISSVFQVTLLRFKVYYNLYLLSKKEGDAIQALKYLEEHLKLKDAVINKENYNIVKSYEAVSKIEALERETKVQREKTEIIDRKNEELDHFFYRISHDLKGPVSSMLGLNSLAKMDAVHQSSMELFDLYHRQAVRLNDIVMGLINLTEIKNAHKPNTPIDFERLVDDCIHSCKYLPQFAHVTVKKNIQSVSFNSEWAILSTILQNLIENGIKYSRPIPDAFVTVDISENSNYIIMSAEDNGQGILPEHQPNIFNMFYRANDRSNGSGLGLYILKRAVERLSGSIDFFSTYNSGSKFIVYLPISH